MAAIWAARAGAKVALLEGKEKAGSKILISGGGRCNVLPIESREPVEASFHSSSPTHVLKRFFKTWRLEQIQDFVRWELNIPLAEEEDNKLFPESGKAREVRDALVQEAEQSGATILYQFRVEAIEEHDGFLVSAEDGRALQAKKVIMATGGESVPATGSDGYGYRLAKKLRHKCVQTFPALVPFTSADEDLTALSGLSLPVHWRAVVEGKEIAQGERSFLFTHKGFSGPAVLDASHYFLRDQAEILIAWQGFSPQDWVDYLQSVARRSVIKAVTDQLPSRLAAVLVERSGVRADMRCGNLNKGNFEALHKQLCHFALPISGHRGFAVAEVTGGGVPLESLQLSTLESRKTAGLYFCGEILDVFGDIGGFNYQWAFVSGRLAGESAAKSLSV